MKFGVVSLFPSMIDEVLSYGVVGRALDQGLVSVLTTNPRDFTDDRHRTVDDRPFGGGPGMVMKPEPLAASISHLKGCLPDAPVVYLSPQGRVFNQTIAEEWQGLGSLIVIAGRYEGIDERVINLFVDEEISLGDFVVSGGEIPAATIIDTITRLVPGALGDPDSAQQDSFGPSGLLDCPHYTRPERFNGDTVPEVLMSGDHQAIYTWRRQQALKRTRDRRPDLLAKADLSPEDKFFLNQTES